MTTLAEPPDYRDIVEAGERIAGHALQTPLLSVPLLDAVTGGRILLKAENLQRTGSFKFRGAFNRLSRIPQDARARGVLACSSGNHAQGVAEAARLLGIGATIVMPSDAPAIKKQRTERSGAKVVEYDRLHEDRDAIAERMQRETGAVFVHPFNDRHVIAGQGTCGLEIARTLSERSITPDIALVCCGGGGLTAGVSLALKQDFPDCAIYAVEPEGFDDYRRSLMSGRRETNASPVGSLCDAILTDRPGELAFAINRRTLSGGLTVSDAEALRAVAFAFNEARLVVEPGGAVTLAAILAGRIAVRGKTVVATLSGGNIDPAMMQRALDQPG